MNSTHVLIANIGSTSFKYRLFDMSGPAVLAQGRIERIGQAGGCPNYEAALARCSPPARTHAITLAGALFCFSSSAMKRIYGSM